MKLQEVSTRYDGVRLEEEILQWWRSDKVFEACQRESRGRPLYVWNEGPPTANGKPGLHHVLARTFKDLFPRYKAMRGYHCPRRAGWDTHGLPVEHEIEKEIGIFEKSRIEREVGVEEFTRRCRESVMRYVGDWERMTERMGFWVDMENAYYTLDNDYVESVWHLLKVIWDKGLLYRGYKVVPYDPRIGATLSSHEVSLGYREVEDPSVYVRFPVLDERAPASAPGRAEGRRGADGAGPGGGRWASFLVWTTTPWTLPSNLALAVHPDVDYAEVRVGEEVLILAAACVEPVLGGDPDAGSGPGASAGAGNGRGGAVVERIVKGRDLAGLRYEPPFDFLAVEPEAADAVHRVRTADFVTTDEGTGVVHAAPAYGADDLRLGLEHGLPVLHGVGLDGRFLPAVEPVAGRFFKDADPVLVELLRARGRLFRAGTHLHNYPHGWRTGDPLIYYAKDAWYIRTTARRDRLVELNRTIHWVPAHVRDGRFGNWLENNVDWALSRERFWGTPLPVWTDGEGDFVCIGSRAELERLCGRALGDVDLHRPAVDGIEFVHPENGRTYRRVPEVIDCWFDSGAMSYAQWHWPFAEGARRSGPAEEGRAQARGGEAAQRPERSAGGPSKRGEAPAAAAGTAGSGPGSGPDPQGANSERFENCFPADYICEAVDQTRGWFYTLHAISTLVSDSVAYRNCICLGHIVDKDGKKMSKSVGNVVDPWDVFDRVGADPLRWYLAARIAPGAQKRVSIDLVREVAQTFLNTWWNTYAFFVLYARLDDVDPAGAEGVPLERRPEIDRWALALLQRTIETVTACLDAYDAQGAGRAIESFVDQLSNWYVRRNRRRFWKSAAGEDKRSAYLTLYECLDAVNRMTAPFMPFTAEAVYANLVRTVHPEAPASVHAARWPEADEAKKNDALLADFDAAQRVVALGRAARGASRVRVRQPLPRLLVRAPGRAAAEAVSRLEAHVLDELNVKRLELAAGEDGASLVRYRIRPNLPRVGKRYGRLVPALRRALDEAPDPMRRAIARAAAAGEGFAIEAGGETLDLEAEDFLVESASAEGYSCAEEDGWLVGLDTRIDEPLRREGLARELVRTVQEARKQAGLQVSDRIRLSITGSSAVAAALDAHREYVMGETLAEELLDDGAAGAEYETGHRLDDEHWSIGITRREGEAGSGSGTSKGRLA